MIDGGAPVVARITDRDVEIFKLLSRYHYLASDDIRAFVGGGLIHLTRRLDLLQRKPNCYLNRPHQQRENAEANYRRLIYELDEPGSRVSRDRGLPGRPKTYHRNFAHELMGSLFERTQRRAHDRARPSQRDRQTRFQSQTPRITGEFSAF